MAANMDARGGIRTVVQAGRAVRPRGRWRCTYEKAFKETCWLHDKLIDNANVAQSTIGDIQLIVENPKIPRFAFPSLGNTDADPFHRVNEPDRCGILSQMVNNPSADGVRCSRRFVRKSETSRQIAQRQGILTACEFFVSTGRRFGGVGRFF